MQRRRVEETVSDTATASSDESVMTPAGEAGDVREGRDGQAFWRQLRDAVSVAMVAPDEPLRLVAVALLAEGHALVEDVPGTGKTLLARASACPRPRHRPDPGDPRPAARRPPPPPRSRRPVPPIRSRA